MSEWLSSINRQIANVDENFKRREPLCIAGIKSSMESLQKVKNETALLPSDSTSGTISKETRNTNSKEYVYPYVHCSVIYKSQDLERVQVQQ